MKSLLFLPILISFFLSLIFLPKWIKRCKQIGLSWEDMNKFDHPKDIASSGGIVVVISFTLSVLFYIAIRTFFIETQNGNTLEIFALLVTILLLGMIGLTDDLFGWKKGGLPIKIRLFLSFLAAIPLIVINAGTHGINFPFFGTTNLGLIYPLLLIPIGIVGATTTFNFVAGFNGLEARQGIIILSFLSFVAYATGSGWLAIVGLCMVASLIGFYVYNKYPAKVFPGDILTYSAGALIAIMAILGNFEKIAVFIFIPYILETILKLRGGLKKQSFGKPNKDNSLEQPYEKIYSLTHLSIFILQKFKKNVYEKEVVYFINGFQIFIIIVGFILFRGTIFP